MKISQNGLHKLPIDKGHKQDPRERQGDIIGDSYFSFVMMSIQFGYPVRYDFFQRLFHGPVLTFYCRSVKGMVFSGVIVPKNGSWKQTNATKDVGYR